MPLFRFLFLFLIFFSIVASSQRSRAANTTTRWLTLSGDAPVVIAQGGFSGLLPDSSIAAYQFAGSTSLPDVIMWCDVQLTKDGYGICAPDLNLDDCTDIASVYDNSTATTYLVNGVPVNGHFSVDYSLEDLSAITLVQGIHSRPPQFDYMYSISTVEAVVREIQPPGFWLNIQHDLFFTQHNLSMQSFVDLVSRPRHVIIGYISSPEVSFLKSIAAKFKASRTKLIFRFLGMDDLDPSTNQTYASLLKNLTFIKTFASGILVPKYYIWPIDTNRYLLPHTFVVLDAHREGLEVYASDFANDVPLSYNYSYDPLAESLSYIDNGNFSVDGMVTGFPVTASEAIGCFAHTNGSSSEDAKPVIISHNGASGVYAGSTDLAYQQAISDGADIIDCSVQMTRDGMPVCLNSINLVNGTTVVQSQFNTRMSIIPEIQGGASGIFTFNLTWGEIKSLRPSISNPYLNAELWRNPAYATKGSFMTLAHFLTFAKDKPISGILINIENAAYLEEKLRLSVTDSVLNALSKAGYDNQTHLEVTIQSANISVLNKFKQLSKYKRMYLVDESIVDALNSSVEDIKRSADFVAISKDSIYPKSGAFVTGSTGLVAKLQSFGLGVYVYLFRNEFLSQAWDFFSDATVEINLFVQGAQVDGIITDFPGTARRYRRNACLKMGEQMPACMQLVKPGGLLDVLAPEARPPAQAPLPVLRDSDVEETPLPPVSAAQPSPGAGGNVSESTGSGQPCSAAPSTITYLIMLLLLGSLLI